MTDVIVCVCAGSFPLPRGKLQTPDLQHRLHVPLVGRSAWLGTGSVIYALHPRHRSLQAPALQRLFAGGQYVRAASGMCLLGYRPPPRPVRRGHSSRPCLTRRFLPVAVATPNHPCVGQTSPGVPGPGERGQTAAPRRHQEHASVRKRHLMSCPLQNTEPRSPGQQDTLLQTHQTTHEQHTGLTQISYTQPD